MTTNDSFERRLTDWLDEDSEHRVPGHLAEVLIRTVATRQRPGWSSLERWLPMTTTTLRGRFADMRPVLVLTLLALLLAAIATAVFMVGGMNRPGPIQGFHSNGGIFIADGDSLVRVAADGTGRTEIAQLPAGATDLVFSPDGTRLAYRAQSVAGRLEILTIGRPSSVSIPVPGMVDLATPARWSPAGDRLVFAAFDGAREHLMIAAADGSSTTELGSGAIAGGQQILYPTWSPDGTWIAFVGAVPDAEVGRIAMIHPDGTGYRQVPNTTAETGAASTLAWSPDPAVQELLYVGPGRAITVLDVATDQTRPLGNGFWATWSPSGDRVSYWENGTKIVQSSGDGVRVRPFGSFAGTCPDQSESLALTAFCGPASWSPDGTRVIATDISGEAILSLLADGSGSPILVDLDVPSEEAWGNVAWQPVRD